MWTKQMLLFFKIPIMAYCFDGVCRDPLTPLDYQMPPMLSIDTKNLWLGGQSSETHLCTTSSLTMMEGLNRALLGPT